MRLRNKLIVNNLQRPRWQSHGFGYTFAIGLLTTNSFPATCNNPGGNHTVSIAPLPSAFSQPTHFQQHATTPVAITRFWVHLCHRPSHNQLISSNMQQARWQSHGFGYTFAIGLLTTNSFPATCNKPGGNHTVSIAPLPSAFSQPTHFQQHAANPVAITRFRLHLCHRPSHNQLISSNMQQTRWQSHGFGDTFAIGLLTTNSFSTIYRALGGKPHAISTYLLPPNNYPSVGLNISFLPRKDGRSLFLTMGN